MKKILSLILVTVIIVTSVVSANAATNNSSVSEVYLSPSELVYNMFNAYYRDYTDDKITRFELWTFWDSSSRDVDTETVYYYFVNFSTNDAEDRTYFNRIGENGEFFETNSVTTDVIPSGYAIYVSKDIEADQIYYENFITLDEFCRLEPERFVNFARQVNYDSLKIGIMGDTDLNCSLNVMDATLIQKYIAGFEELPNERVADLNNSGTVTVIDATAIQKIIAGIE